MLCWRMLAVSKELGCLPWIAQAEMLARCLIVSHLLTTGLSLSLSQTLTHTQNKIALTWDKVIKHECVNNDVVIHNGTHQLNYFLSSLATLVS